MRKGEALALRWSDVDFDKGTVRIAGTLARLNGQLTVSEPKTAKSRRTLPLSEPLAALLKAPKAAQAADKLRAGSVVGWQRLCLHDRTRHPDGPRNLHRAITAAAAKAGLSGVNVHSLRQSAATAMLESGAHLRAVSDLLGHADIQVTAEIYGHLSSDVAKAAMDALSSQLSSNGG